MKLVNLAHMEVAKLWYLEQFNLSKMMKKDDKMRLADSLVMESFHKNGKIVFPENTNKNIYFLKKGVVKIGKITETGDIDFQYLLKEGTIFGEMALAEGENPNMIATAVEDSVICHIDVSTMRVMMESNHYLNLAVMKLMGLRLKKIERRLENILFKDSRTRIIEFLLDFMHEFGENKKDNETIEARNFLSNKDIAVLTATSRQTVNSTLNELKKTGNIEFNNKIISMTMKQEKDLLKQISN